jgi:hypothetical protein
MRAIAVTGMLTAAATAPAASAMRACSLLLGLYTATALLPRWV